MPLGGLLHAMDSFSATHADEVLHAPPFPFAAHGFHAKHAITSFISQKTAMTLSCKEPSRFTQFLSETPPGPHSKDSGSVSPDTPPGPGRKDPGAVPPEAPPGGASKDSGSAPPDTPPVSGSKDPSAVSPDTPLLPGSKEPGSGTPPVAPSADQPVIPAKVPPQGGVQIQVDPSDVPDGEPRSVVVSEDDVIGKVQLDLHKSNEQLEFGLRKCNCPDSEGKLPTGAHPPIASFSMSWVGPDKKAHANVSDCLCVNETNHDSKYDIRALNANMDGRIGSVHWGHLSNDAQANLPSTALRKENVTTMAVCVKGQREGAINVSNCDTSALKTGAYGSGTLTIESPVKIAGVTPDDVPLRAEKVELCKCNDVDVTKPESGATNPLPSPIDLKPQTAKAGLAPPEGHPEEKPTSAAPPDGRPAAIPSEGNPAAAPPKGSPAAVSQGGSPAAVPDKGKSGSALQKGEEPNDKVPSTQNVV